MKTWRKAMLPAALALSMLVPISAYAASDTGAGASGANGIHAIKNKLQSMQDNRADRLQNRRRHLARSVGPHHEMYMELLAEKYAPETLDGWKAAFAERKHALEQLKALKPELQDRAQDKKQDIKENLADLRQKVQNGELTREQLKEELEARLGDRKERLQEKRDERKPAMEQRKALDEEFTKAVAAQDADQIKAVLPKLLEQYKADTAKLAQRVQQRQPAQTQAQ